MEEKPAVKRYLIALNKDVHTALKINAIKSGESLTDYTNRALTEWLENKGQDEKLGQGND